MADQDVTKIIAHIAALRMVVVALIDSHPEKAKLAHWLGVLAEHKANEHLHQPVSDQFAAEFQQHMEAFQKRCQQP